MQELAKKGTITSLELVAEINLFRNEEGNRSDLRHADLLRVIEDEFEEEIGERKISSTSYTDKSNRQSKCYELTKSQATQVLVRESKFVRKAIIAKLEKLEVKPLSLEDVLIQQLQLTKALRLEQEQIKEEQQLARQERERISERMLLVEAKAATRPEYFTVMGFAILKGVRVSLSMAAVIGKKAKAICTQKGYQVDKINDPRFGKVGCYPTEVLAEVFDGVSFT